MIRVMEEKIVENFKKVNRFGQRILVEVSKMERKEKEELDKVLSSFASRFPTASSKKKTGPSAHADEGFQKFLMKTREDLTAYWDEDDPYTKISHQFPVISFSLSLILCIFFFFQI